MIKPDVKPQWVKSSFCASTACVEVAQTENRVLVRDSKQPGRVPLEFTTAEWAAFLAGARRGDFDFA
jgi:hypothetical protein